MWKVPSASNEWFCMDFAWLSSIVDNILSCSNCNVYILYGSIPWTCVGNHTHSHYIYPNQLVWVAHCGGWNVYRACHKSTHEWPRSVDMGTHLPRFDTQIHTGFRIQVTQTRRSSTHRSTNLMSYLCAYRSCRYPQVTWMGTCRIQTDSTQGLGSREESIIQSQFHKWRLNAGHAAS